MLSSDLDLLSCSLVECAQFIGLVSTNRDAPYSIAKSILITVQFLFHVILLLAIPSSCFPKFLHPIFPLILFSSIFHGIPLCQVHFYFCVSFPGSPTSASSYSRSGVGGNQSRDNAQVGVCVSWWKPPSQSPLDQGKSSAPFAKEAL